MTPDALLAPDARAFVDGLVRTFRAHRLRVLAARETAQAGFDSGRLPAFRADTRHVREADWRVSPAPADLTDRRVEITGPPDRKMTIHALNSGASCFMADFEDSLSPTWANVIDGQVNVADAVRRTITVPERGLRLDEEVATLIVRPRGWHLLEKHWLVDGEPAPASLVDFGLFAFHNARALLAMGSGPYLYLPKLQAAEEATLWADVFGAAERALGLARGSFRATVLIETLPAAFQMDEILWELRDYACGLNCGRWDYIFSYIKTFAEHAGRVVGDRAQVTMEAPFLRAYSRLLVQTCHRRGAHAMGGMAAQVPLKGDDAGSRLALAKVRADKEREVRAGHDGTWVAHPGLVPLAQEVFSAHGPNQLQVHPTGTIDAEELLDHPDGACTADGLDHDLRVGLRYLDAWLAGQGCVQIEGLMEDAATAEISRAQLWHWARHGARVDGETLGRRELLERLARTAVRERIAGPTVALFRELLAADRLPGFLTLPAYDQLVAASTRQHRESA